MDLFMLGLNRYNYFPIKITCMAQWITFNCTEWNDIISLCQSINNYFIANPERNGTFYFDDMIHNY